MTHGLQDAVSLEIAGHVADRLREQPALLEVARDNLARWSRLNANAPSLLRCYAEWSSILALPLAQICELLCAATPEGQRLRQNSPFAGVVTPQEVWAIKLRHRHHATTAT